MASFNRLGLLEPDTAYAICPLLSSWQNVYKALSNVYAFNAALVFLGGIKPNISCVFNDAPMLPVILAPNKAIIRLGCLMLNPHFVVYYQFLVWFTNNFQVHCQKLVFFCTWNFSHCKTSYPCMKSVSFALTVVAA